MQTLIDNGRRVSARQRRKAAKQPVSDETSALEQKLSGILRICRRTNERWFSWMNRRDQYRDDDQQREHCEDWIRGLGYQIDDLEREADAILDKLGEKPLRRGGSR
jgi:hypothetical protein